jgi:hypothetical protein
MPDSVSAAAIALAFAAGGSLRSFQTTPLMSVSEGLDAMRKAATCSHKPVAVSAAVGSLVSTGQERQSKSDLCFGCPASPRKFRKLVVGIQTAQGRKPVVVHAELQLMTALNDRDIVDQVDLSLLKCRLLPSRKLSGAHGDRDEVGEFR